MPLSEKDGYKLTMRFQQNINRLVHAFIMTSLMGAVGKSCLFFFACAPFTQPGSETASGFGSRYRIDVGPGKKRSPGIRAGGHTGIYWGGGRARPDPSLGHVRLLGRPANVSPHPTPLFLLLKTRPRRAALSAGFAPGGQRLSAAGAGGGREGREPLLSHKP